MLNWNEIQTQTNNLTAVFGKNLNPEPCLNLVADITFTLCKFLRHTPEICLLKCNHSMQLWFKLQRTKQTKGRTNNAHQDLVCFGLTRF